jgi:nucleoside-diphosphate-sugar epimerase
VLELSENKNPSTFLVTGGAGFLGSHLVERLLSEGNKVICFDNEFRGTFQNLSHIESKDLIIHKGDVRKPEDWPSQFGDIDGLFHLAAINGTHYFYSIPEEVLDVNVKGTINALEFVRKKDIKYFSFASTPEAYGIPKEFPTPEDADLVIPDVNNPRWSYSASKIIGEVYSVNYSKKYNFKCSVLRYNNAYGPRDFEGHVIPDLIRKILHESVVKVEGIGDETRSFCYIDDAVNGTLLIMKKQKSNFDIFNIGIDEETKISELVEKLSKILDIDVKVNYIKKNMPGSSRRLPDIQKIKNLGYEPKISLDEGLSKTVKWARNNFL